MKTILLLGGGNCQLNAAKKAKHLGMGVVLADYTQNPPAAQYCNVHEKISSFDTQSCIDAAMRHNVDGVLTIGTDQPVYTAAAVSAQLGLPSLISVDTALAVTNKIIMKKQMVAHNIKNATHCFVNDKTTAQEIASIGKPFVLKPVDSQGQRGIFKLNLPQQVLKHLPNTLSFSRQSIAIAEHFYKSDEVTVSAWVDNGEVLLCSVTDRLLYPSNKHIGVCIGHRFKSIHSDKIDEMLEICKALCIACDIKNGPLYVQLLIGDEGILVNELACRIGGAFEDFSIPYISGFDILTAVLQSAVGQKPDLSALKSFDIKKCDKYIATQLLFCHSGTVATTTPVSRLKSLPFVLDAGYNYGIGDTVPVVENATARFGHGVLCGNSENEIKQNIKEFYNTIKITDVNGKNMINRLYPEL